MNMEHMESVSLGSQLAPGLLCRKFWDYMGPTCLTGIAFTWVLSVSTGVLAVEQQAL